MAKKRTRKLATNLPPKKGEKISPLFPAHFPPDFDFIASKTNEEKVEYITSILARSEAEGIAIIAPVLQTYGTAAYVVETYLPLIIEVKKHVCHPGRPRVNPETGERNKTWEEICKEHFCIGIRRMQQLLASFKQPKLTKGTGERKPPINRADYERAKQVAEPAAKMAKAVVEQGLGDKFPEALTILKIAEIPVPPKRLAAKPDSTIDIPLPKAGDWRALVTAFRQVLGKHVDAVFANLDSEKSDVVFARFVDGIQKYSKKSAANAVAAGSAAEPLTPEEKPAVTPAEKPKKQKPQPDATTQTVIAQNYGVGDWLAVGRGKRRVSLARIVAFSPDVYPVIRQWQKTAQHWSEERLLSAPIQRKLTTARVEKDYPGAVAALARLSVPAPTIAPELEGEPKWASEPPTPEASADAPPGSRLQSPRRSQPRRMPMSVSANVGTRFCQRGRKAMWKPQ